MTDAVRTSAERFDGLPGYGLAVGARIAAFPGRTG